MTLAPSPTTTVAISLTTIFTPPPSCLSVITYDGVSFWQNGISQTGDPNCYPASFYEIFHSYYSPGICPHSWTSEGTITHTGHPLDTVAMCCPSSYFLSSTTPRPIHNYGCVSLIGTDLANVFSTSTLAPGPLPTSPSLETVTQTDIPTGSNKVWADFIQVRWQSTDTDIISLLHESEKIAAAGSTTTLAASPAARSSTVPSPTPNSQRIGTTSTSEPDITITISTSQSNNTTPSSSDLSTGSKAGIGVSAALVAVILAVVASILLYQRRKSISNQSAAGYVTEAGNHEPRTAMLVEMDVNNSAQLESRSAIPTEMDANLSGI